MVLSEYLLRCCRNVNRDSFWHDLGKFVEENIQRTQREKEYYLQILRKHGCDEQEKVLVMTVDGTGKIYLQIKGKPYEVIQLKWEKQLW